MVGVTNLSMYVDQITQALEALNQRLSDIDSKIEEQHNATLEASLHNDHDEPDEEESRNQGLGRGRGMQHTTHSTNPRTKLM